MMESRDVQGALERANFIIALSRNPFQHPIDELRFFLTNYALFAKKVAKEAVFAPFGPLN
jgi:hypothetical protein